MQNTLHGCHQYKFGETTKILAGANLPMQEEEKKLGMSQEMWTVAWVRSSFLKNRQPDVSVHPQSINLSFKISWCVSNDKSFFRGWKSAHSGRCWRILSILNPRTLQWRMCVWRRLHVASVQMGHSSCWLPEWCPTRSRMEMEPAKWILWGNYQS